MVKSRKNNSSSIQRLKQILQLVTDGFDLFVPDEKNNSLELDIIIHIDQNKITVSGNNLDKHPPKSIDASNPDTALILLNQYLQPKSKALISIASHTSLAVEQSVTSISSRACEEVAALCAKNNSPFKPKDTLYFWRRVQDYKTNYAIIVYIMSADTLRLIDIAFRNANIEVMGITTSQDYLTNQAVCIPLWLNQKREKNRKKYFGNISHYIGRMSRTYQILLASCIIFIVSSLVNLFYSEQKLILLDNASSQARSDLHEFASSSRLSQKLSEMRAASLFRMSLLNNIAKQMEDGSWVTRIKIDDKSIEISGHSKSAANTLKNLAKIEGTQNVKLLSSITRDQTTQLERFIIGVDLK